jgi:hypothetical protein
MICHYLLLLNPETLPAPEKSAIVDTTSATSPDSIRFCIFFGYSPENLILLKAILMERHSSIAYEQLPPVLL